MLGLCETTSCRRQVLLEYFGDKIEPCGNCDNCQNQPEVFDATIATQKALSCVYRTGQMFGVGYLIDVLLGTENERITNFRHNLSSVFGIGKEFNKSEWQSIFRQLIAMNFLKVDIAGHGGLSITNEGISFLKNKNPDPVYLRKNLVISKIKSEKSAEKKPVINLDLIDSEKIILEKLKAKRLELARSQGLPPYIVFHDKTLIEMIKTNPKNLEEMKKISGVGESKIKSYGKIFLEILSEF